MNFSPAGICLFKVNNGNIRTVWNLFKVDNKNTSTTSDVVLMSILLTLRVDFTHYSNVFIVDFKQVNTGWEGSTTEWKLEQNSGWSKTAATSKMEYFVIIVNGCQPLTVITKRSILVVSAVLDPPLANCKWNMVYSRKP